MKNIEQKILDIIQDGFPIVERPYAAIACVLDERRETRDERGVCRGQQTVSCHPEERSDDIELLATCCPTILRFEGAGSRPTEQQVFDIVENLRQSGVIRRLGGVYDTKSLGLVSLLCAGKVPESPLDFSDAPHGETPMEQFARTVTGISAITHNYIRSHEYNVWFTVIAESDLSIQNILDKLSAETALHNTHSMPATRMFKINTVMKRGESREQNNIFAHDMQGLTAQEQRAHHHGTLPALTETDKIRIRLLSGDLPHTLTPFRDLLESSVQTNASSPEMPSLSSSSSTVNLAAFLDAAREDLSMKRMRRFGAVLRHQEAGFPCNAMVCFCIEERRNRTALGAMLLSAHEPLGGTRDERGSGLMSADETGSFLAKNPHVSHCYERPAFEGFPYNVYAMFHASTERELDQFIMDSVNALGCSKYAVLRSLRELKKTSYRYFAD